MILSGVGDAGDGGVACNSARRGGGIRDHHTTTDGNSSVTVERRHS